MVDWLLAWWDAFDAGSFATLDFGRWSGYVRQFCFFPLVTFVCLRFSYRRTFKPFGNQDASHGYVVQIIACICVYDVCVEKLHRDDPWFLYQPSILQIDLGIPTHTILVDEYLKWLP